MNKLPTPNTAMGESVNDPRDAEKPRSFYVRGSTGKRYTLTVAGYVWECSCPAFKYRPGPCKHIRAQGGLVVNKKT